MSTNITIRDIPDDVYAKIKQQAELHHRSINSEVIVYLKKLVKSNRRDPDQIIARAQKLKQKAKGTLSMEEIQQAIDQGRP
ncbi:Arc family DNA-binding protein [Gracilimonas sp.]|uniref:FitA-like ribbon-helix-helix domain-containing protein n=1 Tax=Gracilimonas sp. TaxID=1974203 RepID=UPI0028718FB6|nr:Arc family DNA-binding protein [Gracilimonas sp.]